MVMRCSIGLLLISLFSFFNGFAQAPRKFATMKNGLQYAFVQGKMLPTKKTAKEGDKIWINYTFSLKDSILDVNKDIPKNVVLNKNFQNENAFLYQLPYEALHRMQKGDSAVFRITVQQFFANQNIAPLKGWKLTDTLIWNIKVTDFESRKDYESKILPMRKITDDFTSIDSFLSYKFVQLGAGGRVAGVGDLMKIHVNYKIGDSTIFQSNILDNGKSLPQQLTLPHNTGDLMKGFMLMQEGDSALFRIKNEDYMKSAQGNHKNPFPKEAYHTWEVKLESLKSQNMVEEERKAHNLKQNAIDDKLIEDYMKQHGLTATKKLPNGLVYVEKVAGKGEHPHDNQTVSVYYTGMFLNGEKFDSNVDPKFNHLDPLQFELGRRQVIEGWDQGLKLMKKGGSGILLIPSVLAYGNRSQGPIEENSVLVFEVTLLDFR